MRRVMLLLIAVGVMFAGVAAAALGATTPGWECIPTAAGQAVVSGGTGAAPSCSSGTPVLAPTYVSSGVGGKPTVQFTGVNVQVVNGTGTETIVNGTGNLILGYDEKPGTQTGSHNLLLGGTSNSYTSYGGFLGGFGNKISEPYASILGGAANTASGYTSTITGGYSNKTSTGYSTISGGCSNITGTGTPTVNSLCTNVASYPHAFTSVPGGTGNQAEVTDASVSGGAYNLANDLYTSISGGCDNLAGTTGTVKAEPCNTSGAQFASISGGEDNKATASSASVSGGGYNTASGEGSSVSAGSGNIAGGGYSSVSGGFSSQAESSWDAVSGGVFNVAKGGESSVTGGLGNTAASIDSSIGGGCSNTTGATAPTVSTLCSEDPGQDGFASVTGGSGNHAQGQDSSVGGGFRNIATGEYSSVTGGLDNEAAGENASIGGGDYNHIETSGGAASIGGGWDNVANTNLSTVSGGCANLAGSGTAPVEPECVNPAFAGQFATVGGGVERGTRTGRQRFRRPTEPRHGTLLISHRRQAQPRRRRTRLNHRRVLQQGAPDRRLLHDPRRLGKPGEQGRRHRQRRTEKHRERKVLFAAGWERSDGERGIRGLAVGGGRSRAMVVVRVTGRGLPRRAGSEQETSAIREGQAILVLCRTIYGSMSLDSRPRHTSRVATSTPSRPVRMGSAASFSTIICAAGALSVSAAGCIASRAFRAPSTTRCARCGWPLPAPMRCSPRECPGAARPQ